MLCSQGFEVKTTTAPLDALPMKASDACKYPGHELQSNFVQRGSRNGFQEVFLDRTAIPSNAILNMDRITVLGTSMPFNIMGRGAILPPTIIVIIANTTAKFFIAHLLNFYHHKIFGLDNRTSKLFLSLR